MPARVPSTGERAAPAMFEGRERFAAYVAHELRAPIALQRALVEVALADPHANAATLREVGERVVASSMRQQRLIDALLDLVRRVRGRAPGVPAGAELRRWSVSHPGDLVGKRAAKDALAPTSTRPSG